MSDNVGFCRILSDESGRAAGFAAGRTGPRPPLWPRAAGVTRPDTGGARRGKGPGQGAGQEKPGAAAVRGAGAGGRGMQRSVERGPGWAGRGGQAGVGRPGWAGGQAKKNPAPPRCGGHLGGNRAMHN